MLSEMFWDFQKTLIYKEKCKQSKNKERKKLYHKSATKLFQVCMIIVYDSFFLALVLSALVLALHCYCGENVKYGLSKQLFQRIRQYGGWKNLTVTTNF